MKRIVIGVVAGLSLIAIAACGGGGGGQSAECKNYVACSTKLFPSTTTSNEATYGTSGTCWSTGVAASADACTASCKTGNDAYKANGSAADAGCTF